MMIDLRALLEANFGFRTFRVGQQAIVEAAVAGRDILGVMPTGAGKSLTYQLPALAAAGLTLVVSPLLALMKDQVDALQRRGIAAAALNSSMDYAQQQQTLAALPRLKLLYLSPERLNQAALQNRLAALTIARIVVDEAHCISEWGHDFRPDYRTIAASARRLGRPPITALTATATPRVREDITVSLGLAEPFRIVTGFARPNLSYRVWPVAGAEAKPERLRQFLAAHPVPGIIYTATRRESETLAAQCRAWGYRADAYHGGRDKTVKEEVQETFVAGGLELITATSAFGMGVDKPDVRFVLHYRLPATLEAYYQEAGRAGRDGAASVCTLLFDPHDRDLQAQLIARATPSPLELKRLYLRLRNEPGAALHTSLRDLAAGLELSAGMVGSSLKELSRQQIIDYRLDAGRLSAQLRPPYDRTVPTFAAAANERTRLRLELLDEMLGYAAGPHCRSRYLLAYFGSEADRDATCGCDRCRPETNPAPNADDRALLALAAGRPPKLAGLSGRLARTRLADWPETTLAALARQLVAGGLLRLERQRLHLTERGRAALHRPLAPPNPKEGARSARGHDDTIAPATEPQGRP